MIECRENGVLIACWDDETRTQTEFFGGAPVARPYTSDENAAADAAQADAAQADAATLTDLAERVARIEAHLWPAPPDPTTPDDPTVAAWSASARYEVGDRCTRGGRLYECLVAHGAEYTGTWGPPQASVWTDIGPA